MSDVAIELKSGDNVKDETGAQWRVLAVHTFEDIPAMAECFDRTGSMRMVPAKELTVIRPPIGK